MGEVMGAAKKIIRKFRKVFSPPNANDNKHYVLRSYLKPDGSFDYERYRAIQNAGNNKKIDKNWVLPENIAFLSQFLKSELPNIKFGLCHGTRRGLEQQWFREHLQCEVIGTEIADTALQFPNTIQWDFHEVKPEWIGNVDFIYSNALDHSYNPELCLARWMSCLRPGGICILEHATASEPQYTSDLDPFGASLLIMPYLILKWGKGTFHVQQILDAPALQRKMGYTSFLIIRHHGMAAMKRSPVEHRV
jgi:hypothetical protein